jgi:hypothetical protein
VKVVKKIHLKFYSQYGWYFVPYGNSIEFARHLLAKAKYMDVRIDDCGDRVFKLRWKSRHYIAGGKYGDGTSNTRQSKDTEM